MVQDISQCVAHYLLAPGTRCCFAITAYIACWISADYLLLRAGFAFTTSSFANHLLDMCLLHAAFSYHLPVYVYCNCSAYYLLVTATTYSSAAALTLQGLLALCSTALFLPYWQVLLTNSARLHGTSYCILVSNYYLFAYSYNTLNNTCLLTRIILVNLPRTVPYFLLSLYIHCTYFSIPFTSHCPLPTHKIKVFYDFYH